MRFSKIVIVVMTLLGIMACNTPNNGDNGGGGTNDKWSNNGSPVGEWVLTEWNNSAELPMGVYMRLGEDNKLDIYQHTYNILWVHYSGTYSLNGTTLTGKYADGSDLHEYTIQYAENVTPKQIKLTRKGDSEDVAIYSATAIPDEVIDQASESENVRSVVIEKFL